MRKRVSFWRVLASIIDWFWRLICTLRAVESNDGSCVDQARGGGSTYVPREVWPGEGGACMCLERCGQLS